MRITRILSFVAALALVVSATATPAYATDVPEIDPGSAASAVTLLLGSALLLTHRLRRRAS